MYSFESSWTAAWSAIGARGDGACHKSALLELYAEPHRAYHTLQHLGECLALFAEVKHLVEDPAAVCLALWYHDAIYDIPGSDNEGRSAQMAMAHLLEAGVPAQRAGRVEALILATRHAAVPQDHDERLLVDIDLAILGACAERFAEYEVQIRQEYRKVPGFLFRRKRKAILKTFLERPQLYGSEYFHARLEQAARQNLILATQ